FQAEDGIRDFHVTGVQTCALPIVRADLERVLTSLRLAEEQIALAAEAVEVAGEDLRVVEERYRLGAATSIDLLQSQAALVEAEQALVTARYDYLIARAPLEALVGREL